MAPDPKKDAKGKKGAPKAKGSGPFGLNVSNFRKWHGGVLLIILGLGGFGGYYFMVYQANQLKIDGLKADIAAKREELQKIKSTAIERDKTLALIEEKKKNLSHIEKSLPDYKFIPEFMVQVEQLAYGYNLKFLMFEPQKLAVAPPPPPTDPAAPPAPGSDPGAPPPAATDGSVPGAAPAAAPAAFKPETYFSAQGIKMEIIGDYNDLLMFMQELAVFPKVVVVDSLKIEREDEFDSENQLTQQIESKLQVEMDFKFYSRKEDAPSEPGTAPPAAPGAAPVSASMGIKTALKPQSVRTKKL